MVVLIPLIALLGGFTMIVWIVHMVIDGIRRRQQLRVTSEFHSKLLDRFGSASDFSEFFNTDGGRRFLASLSTERSTNAAQTRILRAVQAGIVLLVLGLGIGGYMSVHGSQFAREPALGLTLFTVVMFSLGLGLLGSAWASYRLSKRMGLLEPAAPGQDEPGP